MPEYTGDITGLGHDAIARSDPAGRLQDAVLSGVELGDVWVGTASATRNDTLSAA